MNWYKTILASLNGKTLQRLQASSPQVPLQQIEDTVNTLVSFGKKSKTLFQQIVKRYNDKAKSKILTEACLNPDKYKFYQTQEDSFGQITEDGFFATGILNFVTFVNNQLPAMSAISRLSKLKDVNKELVVKEIEKFTSFPKEQVDKILKDNGYDPNSTNLDYWQQFSTGDPKTGLLDFIHYIEGELMRDGEEQHKKEIENDPKKALEIYNHNNLIIYHAKSASDAILIKGNEKTSWCCSQKKGNLYHSYRYDRDEPETFYFVKNLDKPKNSNYWFFVCNPIPDGTFQVTSFVNDGDRNMTWKKVELLEPKLGGLQNLFKNVPVTKEERASVAQAEEIGESGEISLGQWNNINDLTKSILSSCYSKLLEPLFFDLDDNYKKIFIGNFSNVLELRSDIIDYCMNSRELKGYFIGQTNSGTCYNLAYNKNFDFSQIPEAIRETVIEGTKKWLLGNTDGCCKLAREKKFDFSQIPEAFRQAVFEGTKKWLLGNTYYCYNLAVKKKFDFSQIPEAIRETVIEVTKKYLLKDTEACYDLACRKNFDFSQIHEAIRQVAFEGTKKRLLENTDICYNLAYRKNFDFSQIPEAIRETVIEVTKKYLLKDTSICYTLAYNRYFDFSKIPEAIRQLVFEGTKKWLLKNMFDPSSKKLLQEINQKYPQQISGATDMRTCLAFK